MSSSAVIGTLNVDEPPTDTVGLLMLGDKVMVPVPAFIVLVVVLPKDNVSAVIVIALLLVVFRLDDAPSVKPPVPLEVRVIVPPLVRFVLTARALLVPVFVMLRVPVALMVFVNVFVMLLA